MALSRKKERPQISDEEIEKIINKGGSTGGEPKAPVKKKKKGTSYVQLRLPADLLDSIDEIREGRVGMSRHAWILEAIQEKILKDK
jgi:hypothetical protein